MSVALYDDSLVNKIKKWTDRSEITVFNPSESRQFIRTIADNQRDASIKLPVIVIQRDRGYKINNTNSTPLSYNGKLIAGDADLNKVYQLNAIPITINYTIDVYTRYYKQADAIMRELIFNCINYPKLEIIIPYNDMNISHISNIRLSSDQVADQSDRIRLSVDSISCLQLSINIDDAYLFDSRVTDQIQPIEPFELSIDDEDYTEPI